MKIAILLIALFSGIIAGAIIGTNMGTNTPTGAIAAQCFLDNEPCICEGDTCICANKTIQSSYCRTQYLNKDYLMD